jgi:carotenoid cleavage dioxygenase-like enzyme
VVQYTQMMNSFLQNFLQMPELSDNGIGNIYKMGNKIFVMNDSCFFRNIDPCTLATGDKFDGGKIFGVNGLTAHPLTDNRTGETYNIGFSVMSGIKFCVVKVPALKDKPENLNPKDIGKEAEVVCSFPSSFNGGVSFVHSFGMTDKYIIVIEQVDR